MGKKLMCGMRAATCLKMTGVNCPGQLAATGNIYPVQPQEPAQQVLGKQLGFISSSESHANP